MVRDPQKMNPDAEVEAAKAKLREAFRRVGEEFNQTADNLQQRVTQTTTELQDRVVGTAGQLQDKVTGTVDHLQGSVQGTLDHVKGSVQDTVQHLQGQVSGTVDHVHERLQSTVDSVGGSLKDTVGQLQGTVSDTTHQLSEGVSAAVENSTEAIRRKPLEALAAAAVAGLLVGAVTGGGRVHTAPGRRDEPHGVPTQPPPGAPPEPREHRVGQAPSLLTDIALGGVGKMVWDVVQREYLTPENIKGWIDTLISKPKGAR